jgi:hypothetical protein
MEVDGRRVDRGKVAGVEEVGYGCFKYDGKTGGKEHSLLYSNSTSAPTSAPT